jgi:hypothetical protein
LPAEGIRRRAAMERRDHLLAEYRHMSRGVSVVGADSRALAPHSPKRAAPAPSTVCAIEVSRVADGCGFAGARTPLASRAGPGSLLTAPPGSLLTAAAAGCRRRKSRGLNPALSA